MSGLGYEPRDMNVDELIVHYEPAVVAGQFNQAIRRLREVFEDTVRHDLQGGRRITEFVHLHIPNRNSAFFWCYDPGNQIQKRSFAAAVRPY